MASMSEKRRDTEVFSMAFLDCICCGFGAVILIFILTIAAKTNVDQSTLDEMREQVDKTARDISVSKAEADRLAQAMAAAQLEIEKADAQNTQDQLKLTARERELMLMLQQTGALRDAIASLLGQKKELPTADAAPIPIPNIERRQYLTGVNLQGQRILFLVRASGSMLDETVEAATARLADSDDKKRAAPKWQRTVQSLEWMLAMLEPKTTFQVVFFNEDPNPVLPDRPDEWFSTEDKKTISDIVKAIEKVVPKGSANLERAFTAVRKKAVLPDSIVMITDGLPTASDSWLTRGETTVKDRERLFEMARIALMGRPQQPMRRIPVSTIMMAQSGEPSAPWLYWRLAYDTRGSFVSPAKTWPDL